MKNNKKYECVLIATNKKLIGKMNGKMNGKRKVKLNTPKCAKRQIKVLMREINRLNKMLLKMAKHF